MQSKLFDFFPVPKFLSMETSGITVSDGFTQYVTCDTKSSRIRLVDYGELPLADEIIENGGVVKTKELIDALRDFKKKHNLHYVQVSIPEEKSFLFKTKAYGRNVKELTSSVELQIPDNVPYHTTEVVFDFTLISQNKDDSYNVMVSVLPRDVVEQYLDVFTAAGLVPTSFQVESQAVAGAVIPQKDTHTHLIVNIHGEKAGFYIVSNGTVLFSSTSSIAEREMSINVFDNLTQDDTLGQKNLPVLLREIRKVMTYWHTHDGRKASRALKKIVFCGTIENEIELTDYIGSKTSTEVSIANVWTNAFSFQDMIPDMSRKESLRFAAAVGLTLLK